MLKIANKGRVKEVIKQKKPSSIGTFLHLQSSPGNTEQLSNSISFILHHWWNSSNLNKMFICYLNNALKIGIFFSFYVFLPEQKNNIFFGITIIHHRSLRYPSWYQKVKKCYLISIVQWNRPLDYSDTWDRNLLIITNLCHLLRQTILEATSPYTWVPVYVGLVVLKGEQVIFYARSR